MSHVYMQIEKHLTGQLQAVNQNIENMTTRIDIENMYACDEFTEH